MTDELFAEGSAFGDPRAERAIDRRQLIKAGAWAAPAIVLATAAPAAAAASVPTFTKPVTSVLTRATITTDNLLGVLANYSLSLKYDNTAWGTTPVPASMSIVYSVVATSVVNTVQLQSNATAVIAAGSTWEYSSQFRFTSLLTWTVTWTVSSVTPATVADKNFVLTGALPPNSAST